MKSLPLKEVLHVKEGKKKQETLLVLDRYKISLLYSCSYGSACISPQEY